MLRTFSFDNKQPDESTNDQNSVSFSENAEKQKEKKPSENESILNSTASFAKRVNMDRDDYKYMDIQGLEAEIRKRGEKNLDFSELNKNITEKVMSKAFFPPNPFEVKIHQLNSGKLLEQVKQTKKTCDMCLHKDKMFVPNKKAPMYGKEFMCDIHQMQKQTANVKGQGKKAGKLSKTPSKHKPELKGTYEKGNKYTGKSKRNLYFEKLEDFLYEPLYPAFDYNTKWEEMQRDLNQALIKMMNNQSFYEENIEKFKEFLKIIRNHLATSNLHYSAIILDSETVPVEKQDDKKTVQNTRSLLDESKRLIKIIDELLERGFSSNVIDAPEDDIEYNIYVRNLERLEKIIERLKAKLGDYHSFIDRFLNSSTDNDDSLKKVLKSLVEAKRRADQLEEQLEENARKLDSLEKQNGILSKDVEIFLALLKDNRDIFKSYEEGKEINHKRLQGDLNYIRDLLNNNSSISTNMKSVTLSYEDLVAKYEKLLAKNKDLEEGVKQFNPLMEEKNRIILKLKQELESSGETIETLKANLENGEKDDLSVSTLEQNRKLISKAIEQLSLIILSKNKGDLMGDEIKKLVKQIFDESFTKNINLFERKIRELQEQNERLNNLYKNERGKNQINWNIIKTLSELLLETINAFENTENLDPKHHRLLLIMKKKLLERKTYIEGFLQSSTKELMELSESSAPGRESYIIGKDFGKGRSSFLPMSPPLYGYGEIDEKEGAKVDPNKLTEENKRLQDENIKLRGDYEMLGSKLDALLMEKDYLLQKLDMQERDNKNISRSKSPNNFEDSSTKARGVTPNSNSKHNSRIMSLSRDEVLNSITNSDLIMMLNIQAITIEDMLKCQQPTEKDNPLEEVEENNLLIKSHSFSENI